MKEVNLEVRHSGCWSERSTRNYEVDLIMQSSQTVISKRKKQVKTSCLWKARSPDEKGLEKYLKHLRDLSNTISIKLLSKDKKEALFLLVSKSPSTVYEEILESRCLIISPAVVKAGNENWRLLSPEPSDLRSLLRELDEISIVKIQKIKEYKPGGYDDLTDKQHLAMRVAILNGYYNWPRQATLEDLANVVGVSRVTFQEHLRKAEAKIIPTSFNCLHM